MLVLRIRQSIHRGQPARAMTGGGCRDGLRRRSRAGCPVRRLPSACGRRRGEGCDELAPRGDRCFDDGLDPPAASTAADGPARFSPGHASPSGPKTVFHFARRIAQTRRASRRRGVMKPTVELLRPAVVSGTRRHKGFIRCWFAPVRVPSHQTGATHGARGDVASSGTHRQPLRRGGRPHL